MGDATDNDPAGRPGPERGSVGPMLRAAREARRIGVDTVARELHLPAAAISALERDDYASLPPAAFVRGYLRSYARLLDLPEQQIVDAYNRVAGEGPDPELRPVARGQGEAKPASWLGPLGLVLLGLAGIWGYQFWRSSQNPVPVPSPVELSEPAPVEPAVNGAGIPGEAEVPPPFGEPAPAPSSIAAVEAPRSPVVPASPPAQPPGAPPQPEGDTLTLSFSGESWASVTDAEGKKLLFENVAKGQVKTVQGKAPFKITLGRPADTHLEYNGRAYDHGYKTNRISARFIVPKETAH
ncbi:helix-turn-helix domain-containing protein [Methylococcus mesophilus]|uniref:helix-turn-helix domain-containing protein n=1 Tax=Methylococcus mesophilus TaxID=2993564 RepID=UPI0029393F5D|nr:RodZ domain-containing protein [Methylococcus mesophilus]